MNKDKITKFIFSILIALLIVYIFLALIRQFLIDKSMIEVLVDVKGNIDYVQTLSIQLQSIILGAFLVILVFVLSNVFRKKKGYTDAANHGAYGSARFTNLEELRNDKYISNSKVSKLSEKNPLVTLGVEEGIILGRVNNELVILPQESKLNNRNVLLVGSSGSGKGQGFIINNIINNRTSSIIVTDPKGELYDLTHEIKRDQGYKTYQVDFLNLVGDGYNPLDYVYDDLDAKRVALTIARNAAKDDKEDHWFGKAVELLTGLIIYVKEKYHSPSIAVEVFREFNQIAADEEYLQNICEEIGEEHVAYQYLKSAAVAKGNERSGIMSTFTNKVGVFTSSKVKELTKFSDINFNDIQEELSIIYVKMPIKDNPVQALTATFFDQLIGTLYKIGDKYGSVLKIPTIFLFDEFANIGKINEYDNTLSTCRGYGMSLITVVQDFAQLEKSYGKETTRTIISNHDTLLFLKTSDTETAKYFEELAGDTTIRYTTSSKSNSGGLLYYLDITRNSPSNSENEQLIKKPLVSKTELLQIKPDKAYAFFAGKVLELEKAYQSKIFGEFITGSKKEKDKDGISRFPYTYPKYRKQYIDTFNLIPYEDDKENFEMLSNEKSVESVNQEKEPVVEVVEPVKSEVEKEVEQKDLKINSLISDFINKIEKEKKLQKSQLQEVAATTIQEFDVSEDKEPINEDENLLETVVEKAKESFNEEPSKEMLNELKEIISFKERIDEVTNLFEETVQLQEMAHFFEPKTFNENDVKTVEDDEDEIINIEDELPM